MITFQKLAIKRCIPFAELKEQGWYCRVGELNVKPSIMIYLNYLGQKIAFTEYCVINCVDGINQKWTDTNWYKTDYVNFNLVSGQFLEDYSI